MADLVAVPRRVIEHFSRRRAEIVEYMGVRGERSARAAQIATLETRRAKRHDVPLGRLRAEWRARAAEHGLGGFRLERALRPVRRRRRPLDVEALAERPLRPRVPRARAHRRVADGRGIA